MMSATGLLAIAIGIAIATGAVPPGKAPALPCAKLHERSARRAYTDGHSCPASNGDAPVVEFSSESSPHMGADSLRAIRLPLRDVLSGDGSSASEGVGSEAAPADDELMAGLVEGDIAALEQLYDRYVTLVFSVGLRVLHDRQLAEDVAQEVFLRLWRRPQSYDPARGRFLSWLMSVTRNRAIDERRRLNRRAQAEDPSDDSDGQLPGGDRLEDPQLAVHLGELRQAIRRALARLPAAQREVIQLAYFGGLTQTEIAERTDTPLGTVKTRVRLAMRKLREALDEFHEPPFADPEDGRASRRAVHRPEGPAGGGS